MSDLTKLRPEKAGQNTRAGFIPLPRTLGSFVILVTVLAFLAGLIRNELALTLLGTVFLIVLVYCFLGVSLLGVIYRRKGQSLSMIINPETVNTGKEGELRIKTGSGLPPAKNYFLRPPAILIRCELRLETRDGRVIRHYADPGIENSSRFPVNERGAYYSSAEGCDRFVIFDAPGFFSLSLPVFHNEGNRLFAIPGPAEEPIPISLRSGGAGQRNEPHYRKTDELTDNRPYVPGDDPRRINWKLYSHAPLGELLVREGEPQPPPHSRLLILVDTEVDSSLYTIEEGRRAVDLLCENALAAALEYSGRGMDILIGYTGGRIMGGEDENAPLNAAELALALAWPAAIFRPAETAPPTTKAGSPGPELPQAPGDRSVLVLALPRKPSASTALERFLKKREQGADIVFIYDGKNRRKPELEEAAGICVNFYTGRSGVHAYRAALLRERGK